MPDLINNRAKMTATGGTGDLTLNATVNGFTALGNGNISYCAVSSNGLFEVGTGVVSNGILSDRVTQENHMGTSDAVDFSGEAIQVAEIISADAFNNKLGKPSTIADNQLIRAHGTDANVVQAAPGIYVNDSGEIGIGTNDPGRYIPSIRNLVIESPDDHAGFTVAVGDGKASQIVFSEASAPTVYAAGIQYFHNSRHLEFTVNNTEAYRISSTGNMGVGTQNPTEKLHVSGRIKASAIILTDIPVYADDNAAAAGGLVAGEIYKTATGDVKVKL